MEPKWTKLGNLRVWRVNSVKAKWFLEAHVKFELTWTYNCSILRVRILKYFDVSLQDQNNQLVKNTRIFPPDVIYSEGYPLLKYF